MLNIYLLCNKHCVGTIHNLSTYVCDRSWGAHKTFIHPLLFLKLGVTNTSSKCVSTSEMCFPILGRIQAPSVSGVYTSEMGFPIYSLVRM